MTTGLRELYQSVILDHNRSPHNYRSLEEPASRAEGTNPMCGDRVTVWLRTEGDVIREVTFQGAGCAISKASASLMTDAVKGCTRAEARRRFDVFHRLVTGEQLQPNESETLGKLAVFSGVCAFPMRVKCASLAWHALMAALDGNPR